MPPDFRIVKRWAKFSADGTHRLLLGRLLEVSQGDLLSGWVAPAPGPLLFVMLNPSKANATKEDPTLRRCIGFAVRWGFNQVEIVNLFTLVTESPKVLKKHPQPIGPGADAWICDRARAAARIVCAWGAHGDYLDRAREVETLLRGIGVPLYHLGLTGKGQPVHPLRLAADTELTPWLPPPPESVEGAGSRRAVHCT